VGSTTAPSSLLLVPIRKLDDRPDMGSGRRESDAGAEALGAGRGLSSRASHAPPPCPDPSSRRRYLAWSRALRRAGRGPLSVARRTPGNRCRPDEATAAVARARGRRRRRLALLLLLLPAFSLRPLCPGQPLPIHEHTRTHTDSLALHTDLLFLSLIRNLQRSAAASPNEDPKREQTLRPMSNAMPEDLAEIVRGVASLLLALRRSSFAHPASPMLSVRIRSSRRSQLSWESSIFIELQAAAGLGLGRSAPKAEAKQGPAEGRSSGSPPSAMPDRLASNSTLAHRCARPIRASLPAVRRYADRLCLSVHPSLLRSGRSSLLPRRTRRR
jgi:hypothetical protein